MLVQDHERQEPIPACPGWKPGKNPGLFVLQTVTYTRLTCMSFFFFFFKSPLAVSVVTHSLPRMLSGIAMTKTDIVCWNPLQTASQSVQPSLNFLWISKTILCSGVGLWLASFNTSGKKKKDRKITKVTRLPTFLWIKKVSVNCPLRLHFVPVPLREGIIMCWSVARSHTGLKVELMT